MNYKVSAREPGHIKLSTTGTVESVLQNIAIILSTRQQSVPLYRRFGMPMKFIDKPMSVAKVMAYAEVKEAIEAFEPRAEVVSVTFEEDPAVPGKLIPTVEVAITHE